MDSQRLRALQAAILADEACAAYVITADAPKVPAAQAAAQDQAIADLMNEAGFGVSSQAVPAWWAKKYLIKRGRWRGIVAASQDDNHPAVDAAYAAVALAEDARMDADFLDPAAGPLQAALIATGLMDADDRGVLEAMSRTDCLVTAADVSLALRGPWGDE